MIFENNCIIPLSTGVVQYPMGSTIITPGGVAKVCLRSIIVSLKSKSIGTPGRVTGRPL